MGLGKTIQAVSLIMALKYEHLSNKPVLVIGPKSTLVGWEQVFSSSSPVYDESFFFKLEPVISLICSGTLSLHLIMRQNVHSTNLGFCD